MRRRSGLTWCVAAVLTGLLPACGAESGAVTLDALPKEAGISANSVGLCLDLGCGDGKLALELAQKTKMTVFALARDESSCGRAREALHAAGVYGTRVTAMAGSLTSLPFPDRYANLIVTAEYGEDLNLKEVARVLGPNGVAVVGGGGADIGKLRKALDDTGIKDAKTVGNFAVIKGRMPEGLHGWTHVTPRPDNTLTTRDPGIRPPFRTHWLLDYPNKFGMSAAISGGRVVFRQETQSKMYAWDLYNGSLLWERQWDNKFNRVNLCGYAHVDGVFYSAEGDRIVALDAATGQDKKEYRLNGEEIKDWKYRVGDKTVDLKGPFWWHLMVDGGRMYVMGMMPTDRANNLRNTGDLLCSFDLANGKLLWKYRSAALICGQSVALDGGKICFITYTKPAGDVLPNPKNGCKVNAIDAATGKELWSEELGVIVLGNPETPVAGCVEGKYYVWSWVNNGKKGTKVIDMATGKTVREYPDVASGSAGGSTVLILGDKMYHNNGPKNDMRGVTYRCTDMATGALTNRWLEGAVWKRGCGAGNIGPKYLFGGGAGMSAADLETRQSWTTDAFRNNCIFGPFVADGMVFRVPAYCQCAYVQHGVMALAPAGVGWKAPEADKGLETRILKGPAFSSAIVKDDSTDWSHYRGNPGHTGEASTPPKLPFKLAWDRKLSGKLTAPSWGMGMVFVGSGEGLVWGLDQKGGEIKWKYGTGGGIRVTPAYGSGRVLVGSDDGWVYCLDAKSGQLAWKFRAAPEERYINMDGRMVSQWPCVGGVIVEGTTVYSIAGYFSYDGTYLYALDLATGKPAWAKRVGDHENPAATGVGVMSLCGDALILPFYRMYLGEPVKSAAPEWRTEGTVAFRKTDGERMPWYQKPDDRYYNLGSGLEAIADGDLMFLGGDRRGDGVRREFVPTDTRTGWACKNPFVFGGIAPALGKKVVVARDGIYDRANLENALKDATFKKGTGQGIKVSSLWQGKPYYCLTVAGDTVVTGGGSAVVAYEAKEDGKELCRASVPGSIVRNGLAVADGRVFVVMEGGSVCCLSKD